MPGYRCWCLLRWALVASVLAPQPSSAKGRLIESVAGVVNDEIILLSQIDERLAPMARQLSAIANPTLRQQRLDELRRRVLDQMVDERLIAQQARKLKLEVTDRELERAIADVMSKNNLTREQLEDALRSEGKTLTAYREAILRPQLLRLKVLNVNVRSRVAVSEAEIKARYQANLRELGVETRVSVRHIFLNAGDSQAAQQEQRALAQSLMERLKKGANFGQLARQYSDDTVTRDKGGDLGLVGRGTLPLEIEEVVFSMKPKEIRGPLRSVRGFYLLQVLARDESSARPYSEVRKQLKQQIYAEKMEKSTKSWVRELRKQAHVDLRL